MWNCILKLLLQPLCLFTLLLPGNIFISFLIKLYKYKYIPYVYSYSLIYLNLIVKVITVVNIWFYPSMIVYIVHCITFCTCVFKKIFL